MIRNFILGLVTSAPVSVLAVGVDDNRDILMSYLPNSIQSLRHLLRNSLRNCRSMSTTYFIMISLSFLALVPVCFPFWTFSTSVVVDDFESNPAFTQNLHPIRIAQYVALVAYASANCRNVLFPEYLCRIVDEKNVHQL